MEKQKLQSSALDLLKELIATAPEKVKEIVDKNEKINIDGPTYAEYLASLDEHSILHHCSIETGVEVDYIRAEPYYPISSQSYEKYISPRILAKGIKKRKKDSVILQSLFFIYYCNMLEAKRAEFKFNKFQVPRFSYNETREKQNELKLQFNPKGTFYPKESRFELSLSFIGFEEGKKRKPIIVLDCIAEFKFANTIDFDEIPDYFYTNSVAIVFPYLRSFISTLTLQANTGVIMLGVMNFMDMQQPLKSNTVVAEE